MAAAGFALTAFASAALLFLVQPFAGKTLLPHVGGSPAAWSACLVFFQLLLLLGYLYADRLARLPAPGQWCVHAALGLVAFTAALVAKPDPGWIPTDQDYPVLGVLAFLAVLVGLPFLALAATAPLLQAWYARARGRDPYFLYAASNAGSLAGLLAYPFLVEPRLDLAAQDDLIAGAFGGVLLALLLCGVSAVRAAGERPRPAAAPNPEVSARQWWGWVALAAVPSSLLLSCTTHLTTDLAPVPLLWVVPLAVYLLTFVAAFAGWTPRRGAAAGRAGVTVWVALAVVMLTHATEPAWLTVGVHLLGLAAAGLVCHGHLAVTRPGEAGLTRFYLAVSVGGVLGGAFNALLAPVIFARLGHVEYALGLAAVALVRPTAAGTLERLRLGARDGLYLLALAGLAVGLVLAADRLPGAATGDAEDGGLGRVVRGLVLFGVPALVVFLLSTNPARFAAGLAVLLTVGSQAAGLYGETLDVRRTFFGTLRVTRSADGRFTQLVHGTTIHGMQRREPADRPEPLTYYHPSGPAGRLLRDLPAERRRTVGVIGLGSGALAAYASPGDDWTFWEIDPAVARVAQDDRYFTYLSTAAARPRVVLGDARRRLAAEPDGRFDVLVLDAFSSDAVPAHLLTREAFALYVRKLKPGGVMAFHLSNRYLDLPPLVAAVAADHDPPFVTRWDLDPVGDPDRGKFASVWAVCVRDDEAWRAARQSMRWEPVRGPLPRPWTDAYSNLLGVWKRGE